MSVIKIQKDYMVWEFCDGALHYAEIEGANFKQVATWLRDRLLDKTQEAPSEQEIASLEKKPMIVFSKRADYWMLAYKEGHAVCLKQMDELVN
jgi:hypothetical protein